MKATQLLAPTLRETPAEAEIISHKLLLRAGMIRKAASGVYTYLPLAQRVLRKISEIVRQEMDVEGGQEVMLPIIQPAELWLETGRWNVYGDELFRLKDRHGRDFALGPTHEEIITDLVRGEVHSYKQLPLLLYQIQNKYRDERRPRFGLMRSREFIMKDLYSFDKDEAGLDVSYHKMFDAYTRIFTRCGLNFRPVEADSGAIGGSNTHEFLVIAESGEAAMVYCDECDYAANIEKAEARNVAEPVKEDALILEKVATPNARTIDEVAQFFNIPTKMMIKTLIFQTDEGPIMALVRGDREINDIKLKNHVNCQILELAAENDVENITGAKVGFAGPIGIKNIKIIADYEVMAMVNAIAGANQTDHHSINVNPNRDFTPTEVADLRLVGDGEPCPRCAGTLKEARGIEVGQVFKLGTKYSEALGAKFLDENGKSQVLVMGCYGIGVSRTMASAIEQNYDEDGIIWPVPIAPFHVAVIPVNNKDEEQSQNAIQIYNELKSLGLEALLDDRNERPGVKFKDADLIGYPVRITLGPKTLAEGKVEIKIRKTGETNLIPVSEAALYVKQYIQANLG
jgi:prolyl-tRNA synthetase